MSFVHRVSLNPALVFATVLFAASATAATAAKPVPPRLSGFQAHVAQGGKVDLAASALTAAELAALRPHYEDLKPRVPSNTD